MTEPIWTPSTERAETTSIVRFAEWVTRTGRHALRDLHDYQELWEWSTREPGAFWAAVADFFGVAFGHRATTPVAGAESGPEGATWFAGATLNYAREILDGHGGAAVIALDEEGVERVLGFGDLRAAAGSLQGRLTDLGVRPGDVVVGYVTNGPEALIALLACAASGVIWAQCAPDYSADAAFDRFGQLAPVALVAVTEYRFGGKRFDRAEEVRALAARLPTLLATFVIDEPDRVPGAVGWTDAVGGDHALDYLDVAFDHPLWILFTSGTTGLPKGIIHGHGGIVLEQLAFSGLHFDLGSGDRLFWYSSTNWVMWNISVSALMLGATSVLYDGSPTAPDAARIWRIAAEHRAKVLGTGPGYLGLCAKQGVVPTDAGDLSELHTIGSTGSILPPSSYEWVRDHVSPTVQVNSISGGTDIAGAFAGSAPTTPVWAGELSAPALGAAVEAWDSGGRPVIGEVGELVVTRPMPSMPVGLWNDPEGVRYHDAYFADLAGAWRQGDWITITSRNTVVMHGRSDATLNRQGVRLGSADIYRIVEDLPEVSDSLILGIELPDGGYWMPLFVVTQDDADLESEIRSRIRAGASPRHVPDEVIRVDVIPHTKTGKKLEVPLKRILQGVPIDGALSPGAVDDFGAVERFLDVAQAARQRR